MKKILLAWLVLFSLLAANDVSAQCANDGTLATGDLTPPGVGLSTTQTYASGQYMLAFVTAGASYTVATCGTSSFDTQLTVFEDATGTFLAYNDDNCGLQSSASFTANTCGYVRVTLHQYSCNSSGLSTPVIMTQNTAGTVPTLSSPAPDVATCPGIPVSIGTATPASGGTTPYTYAWLSATGLSSTTTPTTMATVTTPATYTLTVTDAKNCTVTDQVAIAINPPPTISLGADTAHCYGTTVLLNAGNPGASYVWNDASTAQTLTADSTGTYYVTVTTPAGCTGTDSIQVTLNPLPVVNLGNDSIQCGGTILLDGGNAGAAYLWSDTTTAQTLTVTTTGTYSVTVTSPQGCVSSDAVNISIDPVPAVTLGADTTQCAGTVLLDAMNSGSTYLWSDSTTAQTFTAGATGTYYVTVTNTFSCSATDSINIVINALPVVNLGADTVQCSGTVMLDAGNVGMDYLWNDSTTMQMQTVSASGTYSVMVINPSTGCMSSDSISVTINALPVVTLGADSTQCAGTILLDAMNAGSAYMWSDSATTTQTFTATATGTYAVTVTNTDGCSASDSVNITINPLPVVNLGTDTAQCGGSVTLDAGNPGMNYLWYNSTTAQTLTVFISDTISVTVTNPATGCSSGDETVVTISQFPVVDLGADTTQCAGIVMLDAGNAGAAFLWTGGASSQTLPVNTSGLYTVSVTSSGCTASDTISVTIHSLPLVGLLPYTSAQCLQDTPFALTGGSPAGGIYSGTGVSGGMFDPTVSGVGTFTITYTIVDGSTGCDNSSSQNLTIQDCTGITENGQAGGINVYPNPANAIVNLAIANPGFSALQISIVDMQGKEVYASQEKGISASYTKQIDLGGFAKGVYYIKLNTDASVAIKKLIVQ